MITRHYSAELQTAKPTLTTLEKLNWIYLRRLSLPCKGEKSKTEMNNYRLQKFKMGKKIDDNH